MMVSWTDAQQNGHMAYFPLRQHRLESGGVDWPLYPSYNGASNEPSPTTNTPKVIFYTKYAHSPYGQVIAIGWEKGDLPHTTDMHTPS